MVRARSSAGEHYLDTVGVVGSIPAAPTTVSPARAGGDENRATATTIPTDAAAADEPALESPFELRPAFPGARRTPLVIASPHSGRRYASDFLTLSRLDERALRQSEDSFVDELVSSGPSQGAPLLVAAFPRAYCDVNRERWELDPAMFSDRLPAFCRTDTARVAAGLGTIPRVAGRGEVIHRRPLRFTEAEARIASCWDPYHAALAGLLDTTRADQGACLLLDCHSMPALQRENTSDFVLGDLNGQSCAADVTRCAEDLLVSAGYRVARNDPYAGGYVTSHYGRPDGRVHVLQLEVSRALYLDEATRERSSGFATVERLIAGLIGALSLVSLP